MGYSLLSVLSAFDMKILNFIKDFCHTPVLDRVMPMITFLGDSGLIWILISAALLLSKKYRSAGIMALCALLINYLLGEVLIKNLIQRPRPFTEYPFMELLIAKPSSYSFPSGHTASSFAAAGILAKEFRKYRIPIYTLAVLIAFSRMYLYVHYPTDILGGIVLGLLSAKIVLHFSRRASSRQELNQ